MFNSAASVVGKSVYFLCKTLNLGAGGTWPGEITLSLSPHILQSLVSQFRKGIIIVAGTNGKTTTSLMTKEILEAAGNQVIHNVSGANLLNGIVSACIQKVDLRGIIDADWGVFETDENSLPLVLEEISNSKSQITSKKLIIVLLNLFRDQLDRYGEVDVIAEKWQKVFKKVPNNTTVIVNSDDPLIAHLGKELDSRFGGKDNIRYFGIEDKKNFLPQKEHATDSTFCLNCGARLEYIGIFFSHLGHWRCKNCGEKRPKPDISFWKSPLPGLYNLYNSLAAVSVAQTIGISDSAINASLQEFKPAFGRQEEFEVDSKKIKLFLSKNPTGFNASLRTVLELKPKALLLILNDRIPDGRDVSWIWDIDVEIIPDDVNIIVSGDRVYDMALRIKYSDKGKVLIEPMLEKAINVGLAEVTKGEILYILPTYSAMLEVRKILSGRKIL